MREGKKKMKVEDFLETATLHLHATNLASGHTTPPSKSKAKYAMASNHKAIHIHSSSKMLI